MKQLFGGAITANSWDEIDLRQNPCPVHLRLIHHFDATPGQGYCILYQREMTAQEARMSKKITPTVVTTAVRNANVVTVTATAHGGTTGDMAVLYGVNGTTNFNGAFFPITRTGADTFTFAQTAANDNTGTGGYVKIVKQVPLTTEGTNQKTVNQIANYESTYMNVWGVLGIMCVVNAGTSNVYFEEARGGTGGADPAATAYLATIDADTGSIDGHVHSMDALLGTIDADTGNIAAVAGATNGAAVVTDADGTLQQYLRGIVKTLIGTLTTQMPQYTTVATGELVGNAAATQFPNVACKLVRFKAKSTNTGLFYIGGAGVTLPDSAADDATTGFELAAGDDTGWIPTDNLNRFYRISTDANQDVTYLALA